jgi:hypothetical protein
VSVTSVARVCEALLAQNITAIKNFCSDFFNDL